MAALETRVEADLTLGRHAELIPELETAVKRHPLRERLRGQLMLALYRSHRQADALAVYQEGRRLLDEDLGLEPGEELQRLQRAILNHDPSLAVESRPAPRTFAPTRTVTFLFSDIEGSTKLLHKLGADAYAQALSEHRQLMRTAFAAHGGAEVDMQGDAFFVAFQTAPDALRAAAAAIAALASGPIQVRMGVHTGTARVTSDGYVGVDVHRAARIAEAGHGGQVLVSASTAALVGPDGLRDLGEHRLKDLSEPERIYQLGHGDFPPLKSLHQTNLPIPSTPFLGRERELADVLGLLSNPDVRLLTLTGPGGTGKTRLGLQAAGALADRYPHGLWWVPLAALRDTALVLATAEQALGAKAGLAEHVADKSMLVLFDNFEHVVTAAADVAGLLASCPNLDLLVTSREPLHITSEHEYPVPPFAHEESVDFFLARARAVKPEFGSDETVSEICRRLDDLPLALELAAARVKALSSGQILARLEQRLPLLTGGARDLPERQRTLRATIEWSYDLLATPEEQRLFARLAVFRGGCTLESAEGVAGADLDTLQALVDKSLLLRTDERFSLLETIREYAAERLEESGEAEELQRRHAGHFLALAEEAEAHVREHSREWLDRLEREHDNLRAALDWLEVSGESQLALRLAGALSEFWGMRAPLAEGRRRLERALGADERPTPARAKALNVAVDIAIGTGDRASVRPRAEEALAIYRRVGDAWGTALSLFLLGDVAADERDWATARQLWDESVRLFRQVGDEHQTLLATRFLALSHEGLGDRERARALYEETLRRARASGNAEAEQHSLEALAHIAVDEGRTQDAVPMLKEALRIHHDLGDVYRISISVGRFARVLAVAGEALTAARVLSSCEALLEEIGASPRWATRMNDDTRTRIRSQLDEAAFAAAWEQGRALTADEAVALALDELGRDTPQQS